MIVRRTGFAGALAALILGCGGGGGGASVSGQLVKGGTPYTFPDSDEVTVQFVGQGQSGRTFSATVNGADGTFNVSAGGQSVPAGTYTVSVTHTKYMEGKDQLKGAFAGEKSPLKVDIPGKSVKVIVDVGAKTATVQ